MNGVPDQQSSPMSSPVQEIKQLQNELDYLKRRLEVQESRQHRLLEAIPQIVWIADAQGAITYFNWPWYEYTGLRPEASLGVNFLQALHPQDRDRALNRWQQALQDPGHFAIEVRCLQANRTYHWFEVEATPLIGEQNQILEWVGTYTNIDQRKQVEETLHHREQEFKVLLENTPDVIIRCDRDYRYVYVNSAVERTSGTSAADLIGKTSQELGMPEALCQLWEETLQRVFETGQEQTIEFQSWTVDGFRNYQSRVVPEFYDGTARFALIVARDITELKQAEAAIRMLNTELEQRVIERTAQLATANQLKDELLVREQVARTAAEASQQRFRFLTEVIPQQVWTAQPDGALDYVNQRVLDYFDRSLEEILGWGWQHGLHPDDVPNCLERWSHSLATGETYEIEFRLLRATDNTYRWHLGRALPLRNTQNLVISWFGTNTDIDDHKRAEEELRTRATALGRTTQVLEKRNQELDQFAYVISHDLKAPLRAIANLSQWIEEDLNDRLTDETRHQMNLLRSRVHRMETLIEALLQYSRVGRMVATSQTVAVECLLAEIIDSLAPPAEFTIEIGPGMPTFVTERLPLEQVFANLISNAIKHHKRSDGQVKISVQEQGEFYEFAVADDGPGILPQYHEKVFVIFETLESRDKVENTGIGLSLVKKIVEGQGGTVELESQPAQGATFRFTWPKQPPEHS
jgi:PAS domain S-box-containing protein